MKPDSRHLLAYFGLTNVITWAIWLPLLLHRDEASPGGAWYPLFYVGGLGPLLAAGIVTYATQGRDGLRRLFSKTIGRGVAARWLWISAGLPFGIFLLAVAWTALTTGHGIAATDLSRSAKLPGFNLPMIMVVELVCFGFGEEVGWRGFAQPRLQARHNALASTAILTVPWALWHLPSFFFNVNMMHLGVGGTIGWVLSLFTGAIILSWLFNSTRGSILPVALFHGALDVVFISDAVAGKLDTVIGAMLMLLGIAIVIVYRPANLSRQARVQTE